MLERHPLNKFETIFLIHLNENHLYNSQRNVYFDKSIFNFRRLFFIIIINFFLKRFQTFRTKDIFLHNNWASGQ